MDTRTVSLWILGGLGFYYVIKPRLSGGKASSSSKNQPSGFQKRPGEYVATNIRGMHHALDSVDVYRGEALNEHESVHRDDEQYLHHVGIL